MKDLCFMVFSLHASIIFWPGYLSRLKLYKIGYLLPFLLLAFMQSDFERNQSFPKKVIGFSVIDLFTWFTY